MTSVAFDLDQDLMLAFPTPIIRVPVLSAAQINPAQKLAILQRERELPSQERSNHGGWQSSSDLLAWPVPEIQQLTEAICETLTHMQKNICDVEGKEFDFQLNGWANAPETVPTIHAKVMRLPPGPASITLMRVTRIPAGRGRGFSKYSTPANAWNAAVCPRRRSANPWSRRPKPVCSWFFQDGCTIRSIRITDHQSVFPFPSMQPSYR